MKYYGTLARNLQYINGVDVGLVAFGVVVGVAVLGGIVGFFVWYCVIRATTNRQETQGGSVISASGTNRTGGEVTPFSSSVIQLTTMNVVTSGGIQLTEVASVPNTDTNGGVLMAVPVQRS